MRVTDGGLVGVMSHHSLFLHHLSIKGKIMQELKSALQECGYNYSPELDGTIKRFPTGKDKSGEKSGWFVGYQNFTQKGDLLIVARFSDYRRSDVSEYQSNIKLNKVEKTQLAKTIKDAEKKVKEEREALQLQTSDRAKLYWDHSSTNPHANYLSRKKINDLYGAMTAMDSQGRCVVVPLQDNEGKLWTTQTISDDGFKMFMKGGKKTGSYHVIPDRELLNDQEVIYIAEGYATAASIYQAINKPVVVAFDTNNLIAVGKAIRNKYTECAIIFCADDDGEIKRPDGTVWNPGIDTAKKASEALNAQYISPKFKDKKDQSDYNDLHCSEGLDHVKSQILGIEIKEPEFVTPLGYDDQGFYFISSDKPIVTKISAAAFSPNIIYDLLSVHSYWAARYPGGEKAKDQIDWSELYRALMMACKARGVFRPHNIRGAGVWQDKGKTIINMGDGLWIDGDIKPYNFIKSKYIYQASANIPIPTENFATANEMKDFGSVLEQLSWKRKESSFFLLGWLMVAPVCGSIKWRPHIWVTGPSGSGKSYVMREIISPLLLNNLTVRGNTTEAGIRQTIGADAKPLVFDESETDDEKSSRRIKGVIELCRQSSDAEDSRVYKGTAGGKSLSYSANFAAVLASIRVNLEVVQDKNRFTTLEMVNDKDNGFRGEFGIESRLQKIISKEFADKMFSRSVQKIDLIKENFKTLHGPLTDKHNARFADQYGMLIAGYFAAIDDSPITFELAQWAANEFMDLSEDIEDTSEVDEKECFDHIMDSLIIERGEAFSVGALSKYIVENKKDEFAVMRGDDKSEFYQSVLIKHGLRVIKKKDNETFYIAIQNSNPELRKMFRDSKWPVGWTGALKRNTGSEKSTQNFDGMRKKCVIVPLLFTN